MQGSLEEAVEQYKMLLREQEAQEYKAMAAKEVRGLAY